MGKQWKQLRDFICLGSKITADGDCSHEIKKCLLLGRKAMTKLDSILKSREITLPTNVRQVKAMVFPVVMYGWDTRVWSLGREDPLEKEMATHSSTLAWKIPWMEEPGGLQFMGSQRVGHDWATSLSFHFHPEKSLLISLQVSGKQYIHILHCLQSFIGLL